VSLGSEVDRLSNASCGRGDRAEQGQGVCRLAGHADFMGAPCGLPLGGGLRRGALRHGVWLCAERNTRSSRWRVAWLLCLILISIPGSGSRPARGRRGPPGETGGIQDGGDSPWSSTEPGDGRQAIWAETGSSPPPKFRPSKSLTLTVDRLPLRAALREC
jgi:hypothetical protein